MIFAYHPQCGQAELLVQGELFRHLIFARRHQIGDQLFFSKLNRQQSIYEITEIQHKWAKLKKISTTDVTVASPKFRHLAWGVVDSRTIKNFLPYLNQLGLAKVTFVYTDRSQKKFKPDFVKLNKILTHSCCQCGRYDLMQLDIASNVDDFLSHHPGTVLLNFTAPPLQQYTGSITTIMVGAEGGFTPREIALFRQDRVVSLNCTHTLESGNAALCALSQLL